MITQLDDISIDLNKVLEFGADKERYLFGSQVKVCRNTNMVFSPFDSSMQTKVKCAFLGTLTKEFNDGAYKVSSCDAMTRYEFDS